MPAVIKWKDFFRIRSTFFIARLAASRAKLRNVIVPVLHAAILRRSPESRRNYPRAQINQHANRAPLCTEDVKMYVCIDVRHMSSLCLFGTKPRDPNPRKLEMFGEYHSSGLWRWRSFFVSAGE